MQHRGTLELTLEEFDGVASLMAAIEPGFRSFLYRFDSPDGEVMFRGQVAVVTGRRSPTEVDVQVEFWADRAAEFVVAEATFEIWRMGRVVGQGRVIGEQPGVAQPGLVNYDLQKVERQLLRAGIADWGGPSRCTDEMAIAMGFESVEDLFRQTDRIAERLRHAEPMSVADWSRVMLATEVCFASSIGSTFDWSITTGFSDEETIKMIRGLQRKVQVKRRNG